MFKIDRRTVVLIIIFAWFIVLIGKRARDNEEPDFFLTFFFLFFSLQLCCQGPETRNHLFFTPPAPATRSPATVPQLPRPRHLLTLNGGAVKRNDRLTCWPLSQRSHHDSELCRCYHAVLIFIEEHKSFLELSHEVIREAIFHLGVSWRSLSGIK